MVAQLQKHVLQDSGKQGVYVLARGSDLGVDSAEVQLSRVEINFADVSHLAASSQPHLNGIRALYRCLEEEVGPGPKRKEGLWL